MIASDPSAAHLRGRCVQSIAKLFVRQSISRGGGIQERTSPALAAEPGRWMASNVEGCRIRVFLCALLGFLPLPLAAQRVEVRVDSVLGPRAEVAAAKSELGLRRGLAATPGLHVLPLPTRSTRGDAPARYRIVGSVVADTAVCTLSVRIVDRRTGRTVDHAHVRAAWEALSDSASALGERTGRRLVAGKRAARPAI